MVRFNFRKITLTAVWKMDGKKANPVKILLL